MYRLGICLFLVCALALGGCGYGSNTNYGAAPPMPGTVAFNATMNTGDTFNDQLLRFGLTVSSITFTGVSPTPNTSNLLSTPAQIEFVHQAGTFEPLALENIPAGTYSSATFTVSNPNVVVLNGGAASSVTANLATTSVTVNFNPAITVSSSSIAAINFDLDLAASVTLNGSPVTSATVNPQFTVTTTPIGASTNQDDTSGAIEGLHGALTNISNSGFTLQTSQAAIPFEVTVMTSYGGGSSSLITGFSSGDLVEVNATTNTDGTKLASSVTKDGSANGQEVEGILTAMSGSPVTGLTVAAQLNSSNATPLPTTVSAAVNSGTTFMVRPDKLNLVSLPAFDGTHIGPGQRIEADSASAGFPTIATSVKLREQALVGTVAATPAPTASSFTLTLNPASAFSKLSGATSVAVTVANGVTLKVTPTAGATLLLRGLVFVNGSSYTMVATRDQQN